MPPKVVFFNKQPQGSDFLEITTEYNKLLIYINNSSSSL